MNKKIFYAFIVLALVLTGVVIARRDASLLVLDNAYVSGRIIKLSATADGTVEAFSVKRADQVVHGQRLFRISDSLADARLLDYQEQVRIAIDAEILSCKELSLAQMTVERADLKASHVSSTLQRADALASINFISAESLDNKRFDSQLGKADQAAAQQEYQRSLYQNRRTIFQRARVRQAIAQLRGAFLEREAANVEAPYDGYIYEVQAYPGAYVKKGDQLLVLIPNEQMMIEANVLESEIGRIAIGTPVSVEPDTGGGKLKFDGVIASIVPSIAANFSQLPRNNLDSNWIKTSQRIPVLIKLHATPQGLQQLPMGASVKVVVHTVPPGAQQPAATNPPPAPAPSATPVPAETKFERFLQPIMAEYQGRNAGRLGRCK